MLQFQMTEKILAPDWIENPVMIDPDIHGEQTSVLVIRVRTHQMVFWPGCSLFRPKNVKGFLPNQRPGFVFSFGTGP